MVGGEGGNEAAGESRKEGQGARKKRLGAKKKENQDGRRGMRVGPRAFKLYHVTRLLLALCWCTC